MKYWIVTASKDHVENGVRGGFAQADHGSEPPLVRMQPGDWIVFYSPRTTFGKTEKCQCFTAVGRIKDGRVYRINTGFAPYRRKVAYVPVREVPIKPLISKLAFVWDKKNWGLALKPGVVEIPARDFALIFGQMMAGPHSAAA